MIYVDTSAAAKLLIQEAETAEVQAYFAGDHQFVSSRLLEVELHAVADRRAIPTLHVQEVLEHIALVSIDDAMLTGAVSLHSGLRTLDSLHLATALHLGDVVDGFLTFDLEQRAAAEKLGLVVMT